MSQDTNIIRIRNPHPTNTNSRTRSIRKTPQGQLYLDKSIRSLSQQRKHVATRKTQVYFINSWLLKIKACKILYNGSTSNPNGPKTCGLIFFPLTINSKYVN
jgi:hypothetical protein